MPMGDDIAVQSMELSKKSLELLIELLRFLKPIGNKTIDKVCDIYGISKEILTEKLPSYVSQKALKRIADKKGEIIVKQDIPKDYINEFISEAKKADIKFSITINPTNENYVGVAYLNSDKQYIQDILSSILKKQLEPNPDKYSKLCFDIKDTKALHTLLKQNDLKASFVKDKNGNAFIIVNAEDKLKANKILDNLNNIKSKISVSFNITEKGVVQYKFNDLEQSKPDTLTYFPVPTEAKLSNILKDYLGYDELKINLILTEIERQLDAEQLKHFKSENLQANKVDYYEKNIKFSDDDIVIQEISVNRVKLADDNINRYLLISGDKSTLITSDMSFEETKKLISNELGLEDKKQIEKMAEKIERAERINKNREELEITKKEGEYEIEKLKDNQLKVSFAEKTMIYDMTDKKVAIHQLQHDFNMSKGKAKVIFDKGQRQSVLINELDKISQYSKKQQQNKVKNKKENRGAR